MAKESKIEVFRQSPASHGLQERAILNPVTRWCRKYLKSTKPRLALAIKDCMG
jgi:hypothetical protein